MPHLLPELHWPQPGFALGQQVPSLKSGVEAPQHWPEAQTSPDWQEPPPQQVLVPGVHEPLQHCCPDEQ